MLPTWFDTQALKSNMLFTFSFENQMLIFSVLEKTKHKKHVNTAPTQDSSGEEDKENHDDDMDRYFYPTFLT